MRILILALASIFASSAMATTRLQDLAIALSPSGTIDSGKKSGCTYQVQKEKSLVFKHSGEQAVFSLTVNSEKVVEYMGNDGFAKGDVRSLVEI